MKHFRRTLESFILVFMSLSGSALFAEEWVNPDTNTYYYVTPEFQDWNKAVEFCHSNGLALFDPRYAPEGEADILLDPRLNELLEWKSVASVNKSLDRSKVGVWLGAGLNQYGSRMYRGSNAQIMLRNNKTGKIVSSQEWAGSYDNSFPAVCFQPSDFWYACTAQIYCEEKGSAISPLGRWHLFDFGPSSSDTINRIVERAASPAFAGTGQECYLGKNINCDRVLP